MKKNRLLTILENSLLLSLVLYIVLALLFLPYYQYQINSDGTSYISIAQKYLNHDFRNAICGSWGPLISWLLVPFLFIGLKPLLAFKIMSLLIGIVTIIQSDILIKMMNISGLIRSALLFTISVIVLFFALYVITPDLLLVCVGLFLINTLIDTSYCYKWQKSVLCGLLGAALYLTKTYGLPFFIACFSVANLVFYFRNDFENVRRKVIKNYLIGMLVFSIICICWIAVLYDKYGYITIGTAVSYNVAIFGQESSGQPFLHKLLPPPNETAISAWEDFSYIEVEKWSLFKSFGTIKHVLINSLKNIYKTAAILQDFSFLSIPLLLITFLHLLEKGRRMLQSNIFLLLIFLLILFPGYLLLYIEPRYIWLANILIAIIGANFIDRLFTEVVLKKLSKILIVFVFIASFSVSPLVYLLSNRNTGIEIVSLNKKISDLDIHGRIASTGNWGSSLKLSFYNDWRYYGEFFKPDKSGLITELKNNGIDYYFVWEPFEQKVKFLEDYEEITDGKINELRIFRLR